VKAIHIVGCVRGNNTPEFPANIMKGRNTFQRRFNPDISANL